MSFLMGTPSVEAAFQPENRIKEIFPETQDFVGGFERFAVETQQVTSSYRSKYALGVTVALKAAAKSVLG